MVAGKFWFPTHWPELGSNAFADSGPEHDEHGFSADFLARQDDRDKALEDYLNTLPAPASGVQGDFMLAYSNTSIPGTGAGTQPVWVADTSAGTSVTLNASGQFVINAAGWYHLSLFMWLANDTGGGGYRQIQMTIPRGSGTEWTLIEVRPPVPASSGCSFSPPDQVFRIDGVNVTVPYTITSMAVSQNSGAAYPLGNGGVYSFARLTRLA